MIVKEVTTPTDKNAIVDTIVTTKNIRAFSLILIDPSANAIKPITDANTNFFFFEFDVVNTKYYL